jgi:acetyl esterase/lipase
MSEADPLRCLERGENVALPRTLVIDGAADDRLTPEGIGRFVSAYSRKRGDIQRERYQGQGHTFIVKDPMSKQSIRAINAIASFVYESLAEHADGAVRICAAT